MQNARFKHYKHVTIAKIQQQIWMIAALRIHICNGHYPKDTLEQFPPEGIWIN